MTITLFGLDDFIYGPILPPQEINILDEDGVTILFDEDNITSLDKEGYTKREVNILDENGEIVILDEDDTTTIDIEGFR